MLTLQAPSVFAWGLVPLGKADSISGKHFAWVLWMSMAVKVTVAGLSWSICSKEALAGAK